MFSDDPEALGPTERPVKRSSRSLLGERSRTVRRERRGEEGRGEGAHFFFSEKVLLDILVGILPRACASAYSAEYFSCLKRLMAPQAIKLYLAARHGLINSVCALVLSSFLPLLTSSSSLTTSS